MSELWHAVWDAPRPYVHPLRTPSGAVLTVDAPADHPWHHGLWSTIKFVNGENFWEEYDEFGLLVTVDRREEQGPFGPRTVAHIDWRRPGERGVVIRERRALGHVDLGAGAYGIDWTVELVPEVDVTLDRTPFTTWGGYGGLTLRGSPEWQETSFRIADVPRPVAELRGERARWCHLEGVAPLPEGSEVAREVVGVAILDHPDNPRHPTPWYGSNRSENYGEGWANFCNAAFLWDEALDVAAGDSLTLRHRVVVHDHGWSDDRVESEWLDWVAED